MPINIHSEYQFATESNCLNHKLLTSIIVLRVTKRCTEPSKCIQVKIGSSPDKMFAKHTCVQWGKWGRRTNIGNKGLLVRLIGDYTWVFKGGSSGWGSVTFVPYKSISFHVTFLCARAAVFVAIHFMRLDNRLEWPNVNFIAQCATKAFFVAMHETHI